MQRAKIAWIPRKRRTVLWLFQEDYKYLSEVADNDSDSKNVSVQRLIRALRKAGIRSFVDIEEHLKNSSKEVSIKVSGAASGS